MGRLKPPRQLTNALVPGRQKYDHNQGNQKRSDPGYLPLAEDNAEAFGGPGEKHLAGFN